jgi:hypothetical protein
LSPLIGGLGDFGLADPETLLDDDFVRRSLPTDAFFVLRIASSEVGVGRYPDIGELIARVDS